MRWRPGWNGPSGCCATEKGTPERQKTTGSCQKLQKLRQGATCRKNQENSRKPKKTYVHRTRRSGRSREIDPDTAVAVALCGAGRSERIRSFSAFRRAGLRRTDRAFPAGRIRGRERGEPLPGGAALCRGPGRSGRDDPRVALGGPGGDSGPLRLVERGLPVCEAPGRGGARPAGTVDPRPGVRTQRPASSRRVAVSRRALLVHGAQARGDARGGRPPLPAGCAGHPRRGPGPPAAGA